MNVAIVEDEAVERATLTSYLERFAKEENMDLSITPFKNAVNFLTDYKPTFDIVFMDIDMPYINGIDAAHKLRQIDENVILLFVTNLARYAVNGYEVNAFDYILKPMTYYDFLMKMKRVKKRLGNGERAQDLMVGTADGTVRIRISDILYIEVLGHQIIYHTVGRDYVSSGSLSKIEKDERLTSFARCNNCYLVNLNYVNRIDGFTVYVKDVPLAISHPKKAAFMKIFNNYLGNQV